MRVLRLVVAYVVAAVLFAGLFPLGWLLLGRWFDALVGLPTLAWGWVNLTLRGHG